MSIRYIKQRREGGSELWVAMTMGGTPPVVPVQQTPAEVRQTMDKALAEEQAKHAARMRAAGASGAYGAYYVPDGQGPLS